MKNIFTKYKFTNTRVNECRCGEVIINNFHNFGKQKNCAARIDFAICKCPKLWVLKVTFGVISLDEL